MELLETIQQNEIWHPSNIISPPTIVDILPDLEVQPDLNLNIVPEPILFWLETPR